MTEHSENVVRPTEPSNRDRPANTPGGCECIECGCIFIGEEWHQYCAVCVENDEPPEPDGECFRGGEAASALAEEQARIQRELK